jgi:hypothetical protein
MIRRFVYGEIIDPKSGKPHTAHMMCNAGFVCERDLEEDRSLRKKLRDLDLEPVEDPFYVRDI